MTGSSAGRHRRMDGRGGAPIIEGEARILSRRAGAERPSAPTAAEAAANELQPSHSRLQAPPLPADLIFGAARHHPVLQPGSNPTALPFRAATRKSAFAGSAGLLFAAAAAGAWLFDGLDSSATAGLAPGIVLSDVASSIGARGAGEVLAVEGTLSNPSHLSARVPAIRIALADPTGEERTKPLSPGIVELAPGAAVRFYSFMAVPPGTDGDVSLELIDKDRLR